MNIQLPNKVLDWISFSRINTPYQYPLPFTFTYHSRPPLTTVYLPLGPQTLTQVQKLDFSRDDVEISWFRSIRRLGQFLVPNCLQTAEFSFKIFSPKPDENILQQS